VEVKEGPNLLLLKRKGHRNEIKECVINSWRGNGVKVVSHVPLTVRLPFDLRKIFFYPKILFTINTL